jgi:hypothetical protein
MNQLDKMIEAALSEEDRQLLARAGREPGYFTQVGGLLSGPLGWVNLLMMIVQAAFFFAGVWCAWNFFQAAEPLEAMRWGFPASVLLLTGALLKIATLWPSLQANRIIREVKRVELQLARLADRRAASG